jgi:hypothetical protein
MDTIAPRFRISWTGLYRGYATLAQPVEIPVGEL